MKLDPIVESYRSQSRPSPVGASYGLFFVPVGSMKLKVIACDGEETGWDHVSLSLPNRCPNWSEMCTVKDLFFDAEETVIQLHPPLSSYVNVHPYCLHLWRPVFTEIPLPLRSLV